MGDCVERIVVERSSSFQFALFITFLTEDSHSFNGISEMFSLVFIRIDGCFQR